MLPFFQLDNESGITPVYIGPSFYGDIWTNLQQTLNFSYNMVDLEIFAKKFESFYFRFTQ